MQRLCCSPLYCKYFFFCEILVACTKPAIILCIASSLHTGGCSHVCNLSPLLPSLPLLVSPQGNNITEPVSRNDTLTFDLPIQFGPSTASQLMYNTLFVDQYFNCDPNKFHSPIILHSPAISGMGVIRSAKGRVRFDVSSLTLSYQPTDNETRLCFQVYLRNFTLLNGHSITPTYRSRLFRGMAFINVSIGKLW